jgi:Flp pilus assembly protein TadD
MAGILKKKHRNVVPRWRLFKITTRLGELSSSRTSVAREVVVPDLTILQVAFSENKNIWYATDLLSAAFTFRRQDEARDAATFILEHKSEAASAAIDLATRVLLPDLAVPTEERLPNEWEELVRSTRRQLRASERDAVRWTDLALAYTVLGNKEHAGSCISIALHLAPDNRFVLRAAARCFLHWGDPEKAHALLRRNPKTESDPWLLSAEIALASSRNQRSIHASEARRVVADENLSPHSRSELAIALTAVELESGSKKAASRLLRQSVIDPTENTVAQVQWMLSEKHLTIPELETYDVPLMFEAKASDRYDAGDWEGALAYADLWYGDQPFSSRPADLASYCAFLLGRFDDAVTYLESASASNWNDPMLINNLAYFNARAGNIAEAEEVLRDLKGLKLDPEQRLIVQATRGLVELRKGNVDLGRELYSVTIAQAWKPAHARIKVLSALNFAREEASLGNSGAARVLFNEAVRSARKLDKDKDVETMVNDTRSALSEYHVAPGV